MKNEIFIPEDVDTSSWNLYGRMEYLKGQTVEVAFKNTECEAFLVKAKEEDKDECTNGHWTIAMDTVKLVSGSLEDIPEEAASAF